MLEGSQTEEQEEPREHTRASADEGATRFRVMQAEHASDDRNGKPEKNR